MTGRLVAHPTDPALLELAGQVFFQMGDLPRAGAYWFLTEKEGAEVEAALAALRERYGAAAVGLIHSLPVREAIDAFPPPVQERLRQLQREARRDHNYRWDPQPRKRGESVTGEERSNRLVESVTVIATVGVWAVGVVTILYVVVSWLAERF